MSFLLDCDGGEDNASKNLRGSGKTIDGEIIVSSEYAARLAPEFGWRPLDELTLYIIHGLLHLCGYDDLTDEELPIMRRREREVLSIIGLEQPSNVPRPSPLASTGDDS